MLRKVFTLLVAALVASFATAVSPAKAADKDNPIPKDALVIVVMDPLSKELACDCVSGYAQRDYTKLGSYLQVILKRPVVVVFSESLKVALKDKSEGRADLIIGKDSVVRTDTKSLGLGQYTPIASLTDQQGETTMRGLFVVQKDSEAASILDLENHQIFFGPEKCDEKWKAPKEALKKLEIEVKDSPKPCETCSVAAKELIALPKDSKTAAVISSYAIALLEGCGTVKKGDLRIVGETDSVPFISCFINQSISQSQRDQIQEALLKMKDPLLLSALESKSGFASYK